MKTWHAKLHYGSLYSYYYSNLPLIVFWLSTPDRSGAAAAVWLKTLRV